MLQKLKIQNYAIIDELAINFSGKLNIITGETGAGKSILMGAMDLILGKRAEIAVLKNKEKKCVVEGFFNIGGSDELKQFCAQNDLDFENEILIRREIATSGKSRSFVNDTPVNLAQLKEIASFLVDLHRQFDTLEIGNENFQRKVVDALSENGNLLSELKVVFGEYSALSSQLNILRQQQADADKESGYNKFLLQEFSELSLKENELEEIDAALKLLGNAEMIKLQLQNIYSQLKEDEEPIVQKLKSFSQKLSALKEYHDDIDNLQKRLYSAQLEIEDVADELQKIDDGILYDAEKINTLNERSSAGHKLLKKHAVTTTAQLLQIQAGLQARLDDVLNLTTTIEKLEKTAAEYFGKAEKVALLINKKRAAQIPSFEQNVKKLLTQIGMPNARVKVELKPAQLSVNGSDEIVFLFDANNSNRFEPLQKVASGGELSRLMLSVKSLVAKKLALPVLIFDEIDTGISGEAARQAGIIMKELAQMHQVIAITHQPQIAAKATSHYFVFKTTSNNQVQTSIRQLSNEERIIVIAKMLSGDKPTNAALENAKELMI